MGLLLGLMLMAGAQAAMPTDKPAGDDAPRPRGRLFISPMGEPFRGPDPIGQWFDGADTNKDGALTLAEFTADADRFFLRLDRGHDGEIDPDDIDYYETVLAPEIRTGGEGGMMGRRPDGGGGGRRGGGRRGGGGGGRGGGFGAGGGGGEGAPGQTGQPRYSDVKRGAARFSFFDYPEPITVADTNFNRGVDPREFRAAAADRFAMLDANHDGKLTRAELPRLSAPPLGQFGKGRKGKGRGPGGRWQGGQMDSDRGARPDGGGSDTAP
jgi:hypothetical protein